MTKQLWTLSFAILASIASAQYGRHGGVRGRDGGYRLMEGRRGGMQGRGGGGRGRGYGHGHGGGMGGHGGGGWGQGGGGHGMSRREMMWLIHDLFDSRGQITRVYKNTTDGIEAYTYSDDPEVASWIQRHVYQMTTLMNSDSGGIHLRDPLFYELFEQRDFHTINATNVTEDGEPLGVSVTQHVVDGDDVKVAAGARKCVKDLIQAHAWVVSRFIERGRREMHVNHPVPKGCEAI
ncbi:hypothetical protein ACHAXT_010553 [Thalassiosira profunda]